MTGLNIGARAFVLILAATSGLSALSAPMAWAQEPQSTGVTNPPDPMHGLPPYDRDCMDEYGRNLCEATTRGRILSAFGLTPAEALAAGGEPQLRVFMIDGYSSDQPALVFAGLAGERPRLEVYSRAAGPNGGRPAFSLALTRAEVRKAVALVEAVRHAPVVVVVPPKPVRRPTPPGVVPPPPPPPCLHAWTTWIEVIDGAGVTRRIRNACQEDELFGMASGFGEIALAKLPQCQVLKGRYRGDHGVIDGCATLSGDMAAAAAVRLKVDDWGLRDWDGAPNPDLLADRASLRLPDRAAIGVGPVTAALREIRGIQFSRRIRGLSPSEAVVTGEIMRREQLDGVGYARFAPLTQRWTMENGAWRLAEMEVGAFASPTGPDQELLLLYGPGG